MKVVTVSVGLFGVLDPREYIDEAINTKLASMEADPTITVQSISMYTVTDGQARGNVYATIAYTES